MKILITGVPKSGKSTALINLLEEYPSKWGFVTKEVVNDGTRTGFKLYDNTGRTAALADSSLESEYKVGRFYLNPSILDTFIADMSPFQPNELLYIDEIGQMQLYSNAFKELVNNFLASENDFIGTITSIYDDDFVSKLRIRKDVIFFNIKPENRNEVQTNMKTALTNRELFNSLPPNQQFTAIRLANGYLKNDEYISFGKLLNNALSYVCNGKITQIARSIYNISGNTNEHRVQIEQNGKFTCDCPLFQGRTPFNKPAECSHVQSVQIYQSGEKV